MLPIAFAVLARLVAAATLLTCSSQGQAPVRKGAGAPRAQAKVELSVHALANEGFLLSAGEHSVLIDAFVAEPYVGYAALPPAVLTDLQAGRGVFEGVDVALVSHLHRDHFQGETAQRFLTQNRDTVLATSPEVVDALFAAEAVALDEIPEASIRTFLPDPGEEGGLELDGVRVTFLNLPHGSGPLADMQHMGHVIEVSGIRALHLGDADMIEPNFARYRLPERGIDVAFVPYWYFGDEVGRTIVQRHLRPAALVACHVPPDELDRVVKELASDFPGVIVPREPLELHRFEDRE